MRHEEREWEAKPSKCFSLLVLSFALNQSEQSIYGFLFSFLLVPIQLEPTFPFCLTGHCSYNTHGLWWALPVLCCVPRVTRACMAVTPALLLRALHSTSFPPALHDWLSDLSLWMTLHKVSPVTEPKAPSFSSPLALFPVTFSVLLRLKGMGLAWHAPSPSRHTPMLAQPCSLLILFWWSLFHRQKVNLLPLFTAAFFRMLSQTRKCSMNCSVCIKAPLGKTRNESLVLYFFSLVVPVP